MNKLFFNKILSNICIIGFIYLFLSLSIIPQYELWKLTNMNELTSIVCPSIIILLFVIFISDYILVNFKKNK